jgi:Bifunctional DNA primase/polymerase, N-terminal
MLTLMCQRAMSLAGGVAPVYPVSRDKAPLVSGGYKSATRNLKTIAAWWYRFPDANIGLRLDGLTVIDIDTADAEVSITELEREYGKLPETLQSKSSRGRHLYFRVPPGVNIQSSQSLLAPGIDVVGTGCGAIAPPSVHEFGHVYRWLNDLPIANLPDNWIVLTQYIRLFNRMFK